MWEPQLPGNLRAYPNLYKDCFTFTFTFTFYFAEFLLEWEMFQTEVLEKIRTHILCSANFFFFFPENRALCDNVEKLIQPDRPQMTI